MNHPASTRLDLEGLSICASQVAGAVRLVPLVRDAPIEDLRLDSRCWSKQPSLIGLADGTVYSAFIPHAFVASWSREGAPLASLGSQASVSQDGRGRHPRPRYFHVRFDHRLAKRVRGKAGLMHLRFLPLHTAFEGYLALHFGGPNVRWSEYSEPVLSRGLSPRIESVVPGRAVPTLERAMRVFELREGQVGVLIFVADALAGAFIVPRPEDYRRLHHTLIADFYGELVYQYACFYTSSAPFDVTLREDRVDSVADLELELTRLRATWSGQLHELAGGLLGQDITLQRVYRLGRHTMFRFLPRFRPHEDNHLGELIFTPEGELAYLHTFRLSEAQIRRGFLLSLLASHNWNIASAAEARGVSAENFMRGLVRAGFGAMLKPHLR